MSIMFNALLTSAGLDPGRVRLVRHQDSRADKDKTPYALWRHRLDAFELYQSRQNARAAATLGRADHWAVFVVTPARETLFVGLYDVGDYRPGEPGLPSVHVSGEVEGDDYIVFDLAKSERLDEYAGKLVVEWGAGYLAWVQQAEQQDKCILELRQKLKEPDYPGHLRFIQQLSEIERLPTDWRSALLAVKGVYVLTCPKTKELYVGSATGQGGFYERWCQHAKAGGDALQLRSREPSDYQVSILEVAGSGATADEVVRLEHLWMRKLQTTLLGLNSSATRPEAALPPSAPLPDA